MNEIQYRVNLVVQLFQSLVAATTGLIGLSVIFAHTDTLGGWSRPQLFIVMGIYMTVGGLIGFAIAPNMNRLISDIHRGAFDHVLTKPVDALLLVSVRQADIWQLVDVVLGVAVAGWGVSQLDSPPSIGWVLIAFVLLGIGILLVYCTWLMVTCLSFWFVRGDEVQDLFSGMYRAGQYPATVYPGWLKVTMLFVVPIGFAVTIPAEAVVGRLSADRIVVAFGFLAVMAFLARLTWVRGLKSYSGASA